MDPRTKIGTGVALADIQLTFDYILEMMIDIIESNVDNVEDADVIEGPTTKAIQLSKCCDIFDDLDEAVRLDNEKSHRVSVSSTEETSRNKAKNELNHYKQLPSIKRKTANGEFANPLMWWKQNSALFPTIAVIAMKFFFALFLCDAIVISYVFL